MASHAFELLRRVHQPPNLRVRVVRLLQLGRLRERILERDIQGVRDVARDPVRVRVGHAQRPPHVPDGRLRPQRPERDDLRHLVLAEALVGEPDHLVPAVVGEVEVDVRHLPPLDVQEALEHEVVGHRVDVRDPQRVERQRGRRRPPHPHRDALPVGEVRDLLHHEEVVRETRVPQHVELVVEALLQLRRQRPHAPLQPLAAELPQVRVVRGPLGRDRLRQEGAVEGQLQVAGLCDRLRIRDHLGRLREERAHLLVAAQVVPLPVDAEAVLLVDRCVRADAQQHVVRRRLLLVGEVAVVRGHHGDVQLAPHRDDLGVHPAESFHPVLLDLQRVVPVEHLAVPLRHLHRPIPVPLREPLEELA